MRVMVIVHATPASERGELPSRELLTAMGQYNEALVSAGIMQAGEGLHPSRRGKRVLLGGGEPRVIDGPFSETAELIAGFWLWKVASMDEAVEWAKRCPADVTEEGVLELRPLFETEDFGDVLTPELRAQEDRLRQSAAANQ